MTAKIKALVACLFCAAAVSAQTVSFKIKSVHQSYVRGETVELIFSIKNLGATPIIISDYEGFKDNRIEIEVVDYKDIVLVVVLL